MGLLTDILKEIPQAAVLKEKIADIEVKYAASDTENAILKDDLRDAKAEIARLKKHVEELSHKDTELDKVEIKLLQILSWPTYDHHLEGLSSYVDQHVTRVEYHLERLEDDGYVRRSPVIMAGMKTTYSLTHKGREYVVKNDLLMV